MTDYNEGIDCLNKFIYYRNNKFKPSKSDAEIEDMMNIIFNKFNSARERLIKLDRADANVMSQTSGLTKSITEATNMADEYKSWLMLENLCLIRYLGLEFL